MKSRPKLKYIKEKVLDSYERVAYYLGLKPRVFEPYTILIYIPTSKETRRNFLDILFDVNWVDMSRKTLVIFWRCIIITTIGAITFFASVPMEDFLDVSRVILD